MNPQAPGPLVPMPDHVTVLSYEPRPSITRVDAAGGINPSIPDAVVRVPSHWSNARYF
jgi:hypothetical protein